MPNLSGTGGRSSGVNYATASMFDRMFWSLHKAPHQRAGMLAFSTSYQSCTGASGGSLKRAWRGVGWRESRNL